MKFANDMLKKNRTSYHSLQHEYGGTIAGGVVSGLNDIRLIL